MKRAAHIFILLVFVMQSAGIMVYYQVQQYVVRSKMLAALESNGANLERLTLSRSDYEKSRIGHDEIRLDGMMYDVKWVKDCGDMVEVFGLTDGEEQDLMDNIRKTSDKNNGDKSLPGFLTELLTLSYTSANTIYNFTQTENNFDLLVTSIDLLPSRSEDIPFPPPKLG